MFGAIAGALGSNLVGGLMDNIMGGNGGGLLNGLGDMAQHFLDPLGLFGGEQNATDESSGELKEMIESLQEMIQELMSMIKEQGSDEGSESIAGQPIDISTGSGDDTVTIG
ncbi:MAG: hypothetical protein P8010_05665 [Desulfosarcinaceae bacterium]|jgi:hypothetical protein